MRYGFISDVHGNLEALTACLAHLDGERLDRLIFLGDAVGYGPNPNEVCDIIRTRTAAAVVGNHDAAVAGRMDYSRYYAAAREALDWCRECITPDNLAWLQAMPYKVRDDQLDFCHGAPLVPELFDYLFVAEQVADMVDAAADLASVTFIGHSHLPLAFAMRVDADGASQVQDVSSPQIVCEPDAKYIITVGSVGQPRDHDPRACCGVFDTTTHTFDYHRVDYDAQAVRQKILDAGLAAVFGERLLLGV